jgi:dienelactone hydrolase
MAQSPPPPADTTVLDTWAIYSDAPNAFYKSFADEAFARLSERWAAIDRLTTREDWTRYQREARQKILELTGPFPEKTPLNARVVGVVNKPAFRLEKIIYESQPGFHVTAGLFIPATLQGKAPAIVYCSGHSDAGFRSPPYLTMILNLVQKGFVVLAFDPLGQGERLQYLNPKTGLSEFGAGSSTREHSRAGTQCFLTGSSLASYMIWDGIRSIDYLVSRPEVDAARIGITGRSGGGTQSAYIAAVDERVRAAAPENYITTFEKLLQTRGPQDPEQNFYRGLERGFDQTDLLIARAPKPTLIVATTRDIFSIDGTQSAYEEARRGFAALGNADALTMTVDDAEHTSTKKNREATYAFFRRHLNHPGGSNDENVERLTAEELRITETGQVASAIGGETVFSLNRRHAQALAAKLAERRRDLPRHLAAVKTNAARLAGYTPPTGQQSVVFGGRIARDGYAIEKFLLPVDARYAIPVVAFVPASPTSKIVIYLHPAGKAAEAAAGGEMEWLVTQGCTVIAPDILGTGEIGPGVLGAVNDGPPRLWYGYVQLGKSMVGRQMTDLMRTVRFARARFGTAGELIGIARGGLGPLLWHTSAIEGSFGRVATINAPLTYHSMVMEPKYATQYVTSAVPGALAAYDLPDLAACIAPRSLLLIDPLDANGMPVTEAALGAETAVIVQAYATGNATQRMKVVHSAAPHTVRTALGDWLR